MPISFTLTVITALSMAGVPPFNGFLSKEKFLEAMIEATHAPLFSLNTLGIIFPILAIVGSIFTFVYSIKLYYMYSLVNIILIYYLRKHMKHHY